KLETVPANGVDMLGPEVDQGHVVAIERKMSAHIAADCAAAEHHDTLTHHFLPHVFVTSVVCSDAAARISVSRFAPPVLMRLLQHVRLPQVPGARRVAGIAVAQRAFAGRDVIARSADRDPDPLPTALLLA